VPHRAEVVLAAAVCIIILAADLREAIGFSSFGVLVYYLIANLAAFTQEGADRIYPKALQLLGAAGCIVLVATLPFVSVIAGLIMFAAGIVYRRFRRRSGRRVGQRPD
jgi:APA family basic amino acid/polyamine antiporter